MVQGLVDAGIDVSFVVRRGDAHTGAMVLMVDPDGERTMVGTRGASANYRLGDARALLDAVRPDWLHVSGYPLLDPLMLRRSAALDAEAARRSIQRSLDLEGVATAEDPWPLRTDLTFCNLTEYERVLGLSAWRPTHRTLVIKAGRDGCYVSADGRIDHVETTQIDPVDTTGAGDAFDAAFIAARLRGLDLETASRWGNEAGVRTVAVAGPRADLTEPPGPWS